MQGQYERPFFEKSVRFPLSASAAPEGASFQGPEKSFLYLRIVRCLLIVDLRAIYSLKFTSEASHSRVSAYSMRLTSQDIPQMQSLFEGETGRTNFSAKPTSLPVYQLAVALQSIDQSVIVNYYWEIASYDGECNSGPAVCQIEFFMANTRLQRKLGQISPLKEFSQCSSTQKRPSLSATSN